MTRRTIARVLVAAAVLLDPAATTYTRTLATPVGAALPAHVDGHPLGAGPARRSPPHTTRRHRR